MTASGPPHDFWAAFRAEADELARKIAAGDLRGPFQRVESLLDEHGLQFCFDLTEEGHDAVLVLTPEGDHEQARLVDDLLGAMPPIAGWRVYGRRQRKPLKDAFTFVRHVYGRDVSDATFSLQEADAGVVVTMHSAAMGGLSDEEVAGLVATFLDHALGEDVVMDRVSGVAAGDGSGHLSAQDLITSLSRVDRA